VYHAQKVVAGRTLRAKCSIVALSAFERRTACSTFEPYFWARFAQRCALLWARDECVRRRVGAALAAAAVILVQETRPLLGHRPAAGDLWVEAFRRTYGSELRSESETRAVELYAADSARYDRIATIVTSRAGPPALGRRRARLRWQMRRIAGKPLAALRLIKAAFTFERGADYLMWKIGRHSAVEIKLSAWQRRHPILASPTLLWRLYRRGAIR
jgi:hypothetical protein